MAKLKELGIIKADERYPRFKWVVYRYFVSAKGKEWAEHFAAFTNYNDAKRCLMVEAERAR